MLRQPLRALTPPAIRGTPCCISDRTARVPLHEAGRFDAAKYAGRSVFLRTSRQLPTALALLALDGVARRILLCPPDIKDAQLPKLIEEGGVDDVLSETDIAAMLAGGPSRPPPLSRGDGPCLDTEWILFTSGTSGFPKLVRHTLASLIAPIKDRAAVKGTVWSTFYDIRRYGGLQILLRAILTGTSIILSDADEPLEAFLHRLGAQGVTHISGTPSHWRRVVMSSAAKHISPSYIRLSGEIWTSPFSID